MLEQDLYPAVKALLEKQGYVVKSEICAADVVAIKDSEPPVIVELKTGFSLSLFHQAVERLSVTDAVYIAVPAKRGRQWQKSLKRNTSLCRRLGIGLLTIRTKDQHVQIVCDPKPVAMRKKPARKNLLLREFEKRVGDPNIGGSQKTTLITAYRQDAIKIAEFLATNGPTKGSEVAKSTNVLRATRIMADNHYGWFERVSTGIYRLTSQGCQATNAKPADLPPPPE